MAPVHLEFCSFAASQASREKNGEKVVADFRARSWLALLCMPTRIDPNLLAIGLRYSIDEGRLSALATL